VKWGGFFCRCHHRERGGAGGGAWGGTFAMTAPGCAADLAAPRRAAPATKN